MDDNTRALHKVFGALLVNARYAAFNFYQQRKGTPLTQEEMEEIANGVLNEIGENVVAVIKTELDDE
ncbi:hypothetical protein [Nitratidesulfovibrio sp. 1201_IL3209]|uniref:hypothetical protein n=1 Tax=Nitratidesulfovibrio sp. 1201_IL3209 TaxID=3084053 RepID=UPI002FDB4FE7